MQSLRGWTLQFQSRTPETPSHQCEQWEPSQAHRGHGSSEWLHHPFGKKDDLFLWCMEKFLRCMAQAEAQHINTKISHLWLTRISWSYQSPIEAYCRKLTTLRTAYSQKRSIIGMGSHETRVHQPHFGKSFSLTEMKQLGWGKVWEL